MSALNLNVSRADFEDIKRGSKKLICHPTGPLWDRILEGREFSRVLFKCAGEVFACAWNGYEIHINSLRTEIRRDVFHFRPVRVYAIRVGAPI